MARIKYLFTLLYVLFLTNFSWSQITLNKKTLNTSVAHFAEIVEDPHHEITIENILVKDTLNFQPIDKPREVIDFTDSRWILRFEVRNPNESITTILETARPITDRADLYEVSEDKVVKIWKSGDQIPYNQKTSPHRKNIYPIKFKQNETKTFYLILESDGEMINLPLIFWKEIDFHVRDYKNNLLHGFYFGVLAVVVLIFLFFYIILKEISFLYYIIYVFFNLMLQFSFEGFTHQFIFPNSEYLTNISVLISACATAIFVILYAINFLKIKQRSNIFKTIFNFILICLSIVGVMSLIPGFTHKISYPLANSISLIGVLFVIISIVSLRKKGFKVNSAFVFGFSIFVVGALFYILGNLGLFGDSRISELSLKISSGLEILALSLSMAQRYKELQDEKEQVQKEAFENLEVQVFERTKQLKEKGAELEIQNKNIMDSLRYAKRIQNAILPTDEHIKNIIPDSFILYKPRDIVSGDFYFVERVTSKSGDKYTLFSAVDCTGHGVPGAFMSILGYTYFNQSIKIEKINTPGQALDFINEGIVKSLKSKNSNEGRGPIRDGMDLTICGLNHTKQKLYFSGAKNAIQILTKKENLKEWALLKNKITVLEIPEVIDHVLIEVKGNREAIGYDDYNHKTSFKTYELPIFKGDIIYSYSDGFSDQFGGKKNKKFGSKNFKKLLLRLHHLSMDDQKEKLNIEFENWKGDNDNLDDVLVMGVKV